jgi:hypothetical protein
MHRLDGFWRLLTSLVASLALVMAVAAPTVAQPASSPPQAAPMPIVIDGMTLPEYQGLGCLTGGLIGAVGVYAYSDAIALAVTGVVTNPVLLIPVMATGLAIGCSVGSMMSPAFLLLGKK